MGDLLVHWSTHTLNQNNQPEEPVVEATKKEQKRHVSAADEDAADDVEVRVTRHLRPDDQEKGYARGVHP